MENRKEFDNMYRCNNCESEFDEPVTKYMSQEEYLGIENLFPNATKSLVHVCPNCGDLDYEELCQCDNCYEYFTEEQLTDTEGMVNGGVGYVCDDCLRDMEG